jgi:signal transduction histidine kinase
MELQDISRTEALFPTIEVRNRHARLIGRSSIRPRLLCLISTSKYPFLSEITRRRIRAYARSDQKTFALPSSVGFGDFVLRHREEILRSWIAAVDRHPKISPSDNLTYKQLLDHLTEFCTELAALLKQHNVKPIEAEAKHDAKAHGWKRWRQGYKLDELIREICVIRRDVIDDWLSRFSAMHAYFDINAQNSTRRVVEHFFDNVIIEATVQFIDEHDHAMRQVNAGRHSATAASSSTRAELIRVVSHQLREPLGPVLFALEILAQEESLSPPVFEMIRAIKGGIEREARAIEELLRLIEVWSPENPHQKLVG